MHSFKRIAVFSVAAILVHPAMPALSGEIVIVDVCKQSQPPLWCIKVSSGIPPVGQLGGGSTSGSVHLDGKDPTFVRKDMMLNLSPSLQKGF